MKEALVLQSCKKNTPKKDGREKAFKNKHKHKINYWKIVLKKQLTNTIVSKVIEFIK